MVTAAVDSVAVTGAILASGVVPITVSSGVLTVFDVPQPDNLNCKYFPPIWDLFFHQFLTSPYLQEGM